MILHVVFHDRGSSPAFANDAVMNVRLVCAVEDHVAFFAVAQDVDGFVLEDAVQVAVGKVVELALK